jgi:long-chain acyl-CoA synthetase
LNDIFLSDKLRREEFPKKVYICKEPWTPASGLLTEAFKLKRKNIEEEFKQQIKSLYESK